jgi:hypothetical protein
MLIIKHSVDVRGLKPEALPILLVAAQVYEGAGFDCVVTSVTDSKHTPKSLHGLGYAIDFRTKHMPAEQHEAVVKRMSEALGPQYQVVLESDHIHAEFDPRALLSY